MLLLAAMTACFPSEAEFEAALISQTCWILLECSAGDSVYALDFETQEECEAFLAEVSVDYGTYYEGCNYDKRAAKTCLDSYGETTCADYEWDADACESVYSC